MFDIGFWELSLIMLLALIIVGPERLPGMVSTLGNWAGRAKFMARSLRMQVERELALEVEAKKGNEGKAKDETGPEPEKSELRKAAEAAQAAEEEALKAARARRQAAEETAESQADDRTRTD